MRIIVPTVLLLAASLACAEAIEDPSDLFLRAFGAFQKGEKLAAGNSPEDAAREFKQAGALLKELEDIHPSWNPAIVEFRQKRVAQALEKLPAGNSTKSETSSVSSTDKRSPDSTCCVDVCCALDATFFTKSVEDPADLFLRAFSAYQNGEKLVAGNSPEEAVREFKQADAILKGLEEKHPNWNPAIVEFRKKRVAQALEKLPVGNSTKAEASSVSSTDQRSPDSTCCDVSASESKGFIRPDEAPSDVFLRAFAAYQKGEKLVAGSSPEEAVREFKQSDALLKALAEKYPNWNPAIVEFRKKRVAQALEKLPVGNSTKAETPSEQSVPEKGPVIEKPSSQSPSTEQWKQFRFNGQPYYFVPLMVLPDTSTESK